MDNSARKGSIQTLRARANHSELGQYLHDSLAVNGSRNFLLSKASITSLDQGAVPARMQALGPALTTF